MNAPRALHAADLKPPAVDNCCALPVKQTVPGTAGDITPLTRWLKSNSEIINYREMRVKYKPEGSYKMDKRMERRDARLKSGEIKSQLNMSKGWYGGGRRVSPNKTDSKPFYSTLK